MACRSCAERRAQLMKAGQQVRKGQVIKATRTTANVAASAGRSAIGQLSRLGSRRRP